MNHLLDSPNTFLKYDPRNAMHSLHTLPDQCEQAWSEVKKISFPKTYKSLSKIVVCGMGGSNLGAYVVKSLFLMNLKVPFEIVHDYSLPNHVDRNTLVITISYSGTTEEVLSCFKDALARKAKVAVIAGGKNLESLAIKHKLPAYIFDDHANNISGSPRMGIGFTLFGLVGILKKLGYIKLTDSEVGASITHMRLAGSTWNGEVNIRNNTAKKLADILHDKIPVYVASDHIWGNARILQNQTHETCKAFSAHFDIPELNHHLMEGLAHPKEKRALHFVMLQSKLYSASIQKRYAVTTSVINKNNIDVTAIDLDGKTKLAQVLEVLLFGGYVTFYMAMLNKQDPTPNPFVDYFKKELKK